MSLEAKPVDRPLAGIRIVDAVAGPLAPLTRWLAELGARVERVVAPADDALVDAAANIGKRTIGQGGLADALTSAHAVVADSFHAAKLDLAALRAERSALVTMAVSDFGGDTAYSEWQATDPVLHALSGELSRSGIRGRPPLLPPGDLAYQCAAAQGAFALASALYRALRTGHGDHIDFSALDGAVQALDPGYGISGSATMGKPAHLLSRDRPARGFQYPIIRCADGAVRICLLSRRQWQGMFRWMGCPPAFAGPEFERMSVRYKSPDLIPAIAAFFATRGRADLETEGQAHGVPISAVSTFEEALAADHFAARGALTRVETTLGRVILLPNGVVEIDGERMGPAADDAVAAISWLRPSPSDDLPFADLKVLDLGVIVVGAEQGRLFGDGGADVVKVESRAYPDGNRQSYLDYGLSVSFAAGHRNKRSLGINLREAAGRDLFLELVRRADVVLSNFKPGTMEALGLGPDVLAEANPRLVMSESSAFGPTGPWSGRMGYGPLVRAATGLTTAWRYPDDPAGYSDATTIYPDHVAARIAAMSTVALLIRRLRTERGGQSSVAQAEVVLAQFGLDVARASIGEPNGEPDDHPWGAYPARGDDEWCVVTVRGDEDWRALATKLGSDEAALETRAGRLANADAIDVRLRAWLSERDAEAAAEELQAGGVPAARMLRVGDLPSFGYYRERELFRTERHPHLVEDVVAERWSAKRPHGPEAPTRAAPLMGEQSEAVIADWLGATVDIAALVATGILEPTDPETWAGVRRALGDAAAA